jgi:hypothetical protein
VVRKTFPSSIDGWSIIYLSKPGFINFPWNVQSKRGKNILGFASNSALRVQFRAWPSSGPTFIIFVPKYRNWIDIKKVLETSWFWFHSPLLLFYKRKKGAAPYKARELVVSKIEHWLHYCINCILYYFFPKRDTS